VREQGRRAAAAAAAALAVAGDIGHVRLRFGFFDWDPEALEARPAAPDPSFRLQVLDPDHERPHAAKRPRDPRLVRLSPAWREGDRVVVDVATRGGPAVLRVERDGCAAVDVPVRALPGYVEDRARVEGGEALPVWELVVPSCAATRVDMVVVGGGVFVDGGIGEPEIESAIRPDQEAMHHLDAFAIDVTAAPNALWRVFGRSAHLTGVLGPTYPARTFLPHAAEPDHPVTSIDAFAAEAFCRWLGRRLPTSQEWTKAARGGLELVPGVPNPYPRRNLPWGGDDASIEAMAGRANLADLADGWVGTAPVRALTAGAGPYGTIGQGGNVSEWTETPVDGASTTINVMRIVRGAEWGFPSSAGIHSLAGANMRSPRTIMYSLGVRCASERVHEFPPPELASR
jgi:formylglycine-generating enzyme required for sulfatase activity